MINFQKDQTLISNFLKGEKKSFSELVKKHKHRILSKLQLIVKDTGLAEDLMQETFLKAHQVISEGRYNEKGQFLPWILRIAHNKAIDSIRKQKRNPLVFIDHSSEYISGLHFYELNNKEDNFLQSRIRELEYWINKLPKNQQEVVRMRGFLGMSFQDIADETGVSINTALGRMRYAIMTLKKNMVRNSPKVSTDTRILAGTA